MSHDSHEEHHIVEYSLHAKVLGTLLFLTAITVGAAYVDFGNLSTMIAILIATVKALVVALYFMHLKFETKMLGLFVLMTFAIFTIFILIAFSDYGLRHIL